jgi:outer membrane receptor protein involved in Fe transport
MPSLMVRGLPAQYSLSGMNTLRSGLSIDNAFVERIEVLKGPSGVIGGVADFGGRGGAVNLVRRSIETQPYVEFKQGLSSRDGGTLRTDLDAAGQLAPHSYWRAMAYGSRTGQTDGGYDPQFAGGLLGVLGYRGTDLKATLTLQTDNQRIAPSPTSRGVRRRADGTYTGVEKGQEGRGRCNGWAALALFGRRARPQLAAVCAMANDVEGPRRTTGQQHEPPLLRGPR